ncbi:hypothetical protein L226DRAFT_93588 [Lentinus tigrinus ALCF2SS1-7]|uniref:uncharacterized protein n=1 Tax=Lentinus tigrinus ALCF2SS1-7 TaxID=1328758 RepID=UPI001165F9BB|nr:hypothetical protein L226DRAFT_93588 [Lentinus tigrinus ALCF2SS1-7]
MSTIRTHRRDLSTLYGGRSPRIRDLLVPRTTPHFPRSGTALEPYPLWLLLQVGMRSRLPWPAFPQPCIAEYKPSCTITMKLCSRSSGRGQVPPRMRRAHPDLGHLGCNVTLLRSSSICFSRVIVRVSVQVVIPVAPTASMRLCDACSRVPLSARFLWHACKHASAVHPDVAGRLRRWDGIRHMCRSRVRMTLA